MNVAQIFRLSCRVAPNTNKSRWQNSEGVVTPSTAQVKKDTDNADINLADGVSPLHRWLAPISPLSPITQLKTTETPLDNPQTQSTQVSSPHRDGG